MRKTKEDQAFDEWWDNVGQFSSIPFQVDKEDCRIGWEGAFKWRDSQISEPIYIVGKGWQCDDMPPAGLRLYTNPTARINEDLIEALEGFCSLMQYEYTGSKEAMIALQEADNQAQKVLKLLKEHDE